MTTIAYKDGIIASDTQITWDGSIKGNSGPKVIELPSGVVIGAAGRTDAINQAQRFFADPEWETKLDDAPKLKGSFEAIMLYKGKIYVCNGACFPELLYDDVYAVGSGYKFALAALHLGLSAEEAVKFASTLDVFTNDKVQVFNVKNYKAKATKPKRV